MLSALLPATNSFEAVFGNGSTPFWFFSSTNWEMMIKVLNGCGVNNRYWVFTGVTTNVGWTMRVTDTLTNVTKIYSSPNGTASCPILDTNAFATCP